MRTQVGDFRVQASAGEMRGAIDHRTAEGVGRFQFGRLESHRVTGTGKIKRHAGLIFGGAPIAGSVTGNRWYRFIQSPVGQRPTCHYRFGIAAPGFLESAPVSSGNILLQPQESVHDLGLGRDFQSGRPGWPRRIAAQVMLFRGRDIALGAVGQFDVD